VQANGFNPQTKTVSPVLSPLLHAGFVLTGVVNTMLGPLLPVLSTRWKLNDTQAGFLFMFQFGGSMLGVAASSFVTPRCGSRVSLVLGMGIMGLGTGALELGNWVLGIIWAFVVGIGLGLTIPTTNLLISELNPGRRAAALNLVNFSWGLGAVACPFVVAGLLRVNRGSLFLYGSAGLMVLLAAALLRVSFDDSRQHEIHAAPASSLRKSHWRSRYVPILGAIFFLYVGSETAVGGWTASYARRIISDGGTAWAMMPSFFWAALLVGRAVAPFLLRRLPELMLARLGLGLGAIGIIALHSATNTTAVAISVGVAGLGFSSVYPIAIATLSHQFGAMASRVAGLMFTLAGLGGATLPWLVGYASTWYGSLKFGLLVPLGGCLAMLIMHALLSPPARDSGYSGGEIGASEDTP
jgi:fucose permease